MLRGRTRDWFNLWILVIGLSTSAELALSESNFEAALLQAEEALAISQELVKERRGFKRDIAWSLYLTAQVEIRRGNYTAARKAFDEILSITGASNDWNLPIYLTCLAEVVAMQGESIRAARLLGMAETLQATVGIPFAPAYQADRDRIVALIRSLLHEQAFTIARDEGRDMTLEQVLAEPGQAELLLPITGEQSLPPLAKSSPVFPAGLTTREVEVLRLVAQGLTDTLIAEQLIISPRTVNTHLTSIYNKLGVSSRAAATRFAMEHHLL